ncbi:hypothetical protein ACLOJK_005065 [Asimina triloba]
MGRADGSARWRRRDGDEMATVRRRRDVGRGCSAAADWGDGDSAATRWTVPEKEQTTGHLGEMGTASRRDGTAVVGLLCCCRLRRWGQCGDEMDSVREGADGWASRQDGDGVVARWNGTDETALLLPIGEMGTVWVTRWTVPEKEQTGGRLSEMERRRWEEVVEAKNTWLGFLGSCRVVFECNRSRGPAAVQRGTRLKCAAACPPARVNPVHGRKESKQAKALFVLFRTTAPLAALDPHHATESNPDFSVSFHFRLTTSLCPFKSARPRASKTPIPLPPFGIPTKKKNLLPPSISDCLLL